jgi:ABC-2 type transport system ATP-binding protein
MTTPMIKTRSLTRHFTTRKETVEAVRGLDLEVGDGELVAFLGPNGAGKSTTLRMLTTLIPPTSGSAQVAGHDITSAQREVRRSIGYIGQGTGAGMAQRGRDELYSQGRAYGLDRATARRRAQELLDSLDLDGVADRPVSSLSGGQRRRLDIALGLVHAPRLLFLDEPSTGLDPQNRANLADHVVALREQHGATVVLTTHYLDEADLLAERVVVIDHGQVIADDSPERLKAELAGDRMTLELADEPVARLAAAMVRRLEGARDVALDGGRLDARVVGGPALLPGLLRVLDAEGVAVRSAQVIPPTLDDVFLNLTGRSLREGGAEPADGQQLIDQPAEGQPAEPAAAGTAFAASDPIRQGVPA